MAGRGNILFVTGTDTGVGKTVLTALLVRALRREGWDALAMKPFCSGSRSDVRLLRAAQENRLTAEEINPFYFDKPVAPGTGAGRGPKNTHLDSVLKKIRALAERCDVLLVEGSGGLMVPLGKNYTVADLIAKLKCPTLVASRNRLGTINHTLLTIRMMQAFGIKGIGIGLIDQPDADFSAKTNQKMIRKWAREVPIFWVPNLGRGASKRGSLKINVKKMKKVLARIRNHDSFVTVLRGNSKKRLFNKIR